MEELCALKKVEIEELEKKNFRIGNVLKGKFIFFLKQLGPKYTDGEHVIEIYKNIYL